MKPHKEMSELQKAYLAIKEIEKSIKSHGQDQVYQTVFGRHRQTIEKARKQYYE